MPFGPIVAGQFYTANPKELAKEIDGYLTEAVVPALPEPVFGLISPHAGYIYSGPCAAYGYKAVAGQAFDVVVVIGLSHRVPGDVSVLDADFYRTPLGDIPIDRERTKKLLGAESFIRDDKKLFASEHSIEVQLPFLQRTIPNLKVVLVSMRTFSSDRCARLAAALDRVFGDCRALFVASTDLSHFHPYGEASAMDRATLDLVRSMDLTRLADDCDSGTEGMCGIAPVLTLMNLFGGRGGSKVEVLKYMNSGDTAGDRERVVGYGSVALLGGKLMREKSENSEASSGKYLSEEDKINCLEIARKSIESFVRDSVMPKIENISTGLMRPGAAFVSLHKKGDLRGCVGQIVARGPLWMCVRDMAVAAATQDSRFKSLRKEEIPDLDIEISVLTPMEDVDDPEKIEVGADGLMISLGYYRGLLLPQVAADYGWDREEFLSHTCMKAGLPPDAWRDPKTTIQKFQAQVFGEKSEQRP